ncbi:MAG: hypothetical protein IH865_00765 [Chloroflexi bacterium]|nr:hypothetical protein [Chloroflexota bacterium]
MRTSTAPSATNAGQRNHARTVMLAFPIVARTHRNVRHAFLASYVKGILP